MWLTIDWRASIRSKITVPSRPIPEAAPQIDFLRHEWHSSQPQSFYPSVSIITFNDKNLKFLWISSPFNTILFLLESIKWDISFVKIVSSRRNLFPEQQLTREFGRPRAETGGGQVKTQRLKGSSQEIDQSSDTRTQGWFLIGKILR